jgi:cytochrome c-type biogenesis protein CcmF
MTVLLGEYALSGAMLTALAIVMAAIAYWQLRNDGLLRAMRWGMALLAALLTVSSWGLLKALLDDNFALSYVLEHSQRAMPLGYKFAAFWAGQQGSLLFWAWVLGVMGVLLAWSLRKNEDLAAAVSLAVMAIVIGFFTCIMLFATDDRGHAVGNPFDVAAMRAQDGMGLNPQLQTPAMAFHPPMLFLGYAGYTVPFALLLGALVKGRVPTLKHTGRAPQTQTQGGSLVLEYQSAKSISSLDESWLTLARPWMVFSWITLTVGIVLGAQWAYMELGWGGYWAWDPVENASLFPWLTGTALLHSAILQVNRGMFKRWTASWTATSFFLCILGTYLTRSGVIQSVHAFEQSSIGMFFMLFLGVIALGSVLAILIRLGLLQGERTLEDIVSREGFFLIANVLLTIMTATIIVGTLYPLISNIFGDPVTVNAPFYNKVILPMALGLAALMSTGPVLGSGAGAADRARPKLAGMLIAALATAALVFILGFTNLWALVSAAVIGAIVTAIVVDVVTVLRGKSDLGGTALRAFIQRPRHWGAQLAHLGMAAMVAGVAGSSLYGETHTAVLHAGKKDPPVQAGGYTLELVKLEHVEQKNYFAEVATVSFRNARESFEMQPELRTFNRGSQAMTSTEVALRPGLLTDMYVTLAGAEPDHSAVGIKIMIQPLVNWIWIGGALLTLGGLVCMIPTGRKPAPIPAPETSAPPAVLTGKNKRERERARAMTHPAPAERR